MKMYVTLFLFVTSLTLTHAQIVVIPDLNFKNALINTDCVDTNNSGFGDSDADLNGDGQIQVSEAEAVLFLDLYNEDIDSLEGIEAFVNLMGLDVSDNNLTTLDVDFMTEVIKFNCSNNQLVTLEWPSLTTVEKSFKCENMNTLLNVNLNGLIDSGENFEISSNNNLASVDISNLQTADVFTFMDNDGIQSLDIGSLNAAGNFLVYRCDALESLNVGSLTQVDRVCSISELDTLINLNVSNLTTVGGLFFQNNDSIATADFSSLTNIIDYDLENEGSGGDVMFNYLPSLTNLNLNQLHSVDKTFACLTQAFSLDLSNLISVSQNVIIRSNNLTSINLSSLVTIGGDFIYSGADNASIDLQNLVSVNDVIANFQGIDNLNLESLESVNVLDLNYNNLTTLDLSSLTQGETVNLGNNDLVSVTFGTAQLNQVDLSYNELITLDLSGVATAPFGGIDIIQNPDLQLLFMKNGSISETIYVNGSNNLQYICVDAEERDAIQINVNQLNNCVVNSYCSFVPGGEYYTIEGDNILDSNNNGCDESDMVFPNLKYSVFDGTNERVYIPDALGEYTILLPAGMQTVTPLLENPSYFNVSPPSLMVDFPVDGSSIIQNFCVSPNGIIDDLEVVIIPISDARPGLQATYKLLYKNKGNRAQSGYLEFYFSDNSDVSSYVSAEPAEETNVNDVLTWNFIDLQPYEIREIDIVLDLNTPTDPINPLNTGDILSYNAKIFPVADDETPSDNGASLRQTVINSFDPNDKRCLEGETITPEMTGRYVHYMIRFENTGTANAINVVVKDEIDISKFDIATLVPLSSSHEFVTRIQNTNEVEFIFENINLPFDDANNDGYVVFKIKTLESLTLGDTFSNDAEIYFDFNAPIITNDFATTVEESLSIDNLAFNSDVVLYPNPVNDMLYIASEISMDSASVYDIHGRELQTTIFVGNETQRAIDVNQLSRGTYFVTFTSEHGKITQKIIKN